MVFAVSSVLNLNRPLPILRGLGGANWREFMKSVIFAALVALAFPVVASADSERTPSPPGAKVYIIEPSDGATVSSPVTVKFGVEGMEVAPAGSDKPNTGHHHLIVDAEVTDYNSAIPKDDHHIHYGKGQTE